MPNPILSNFHQADHSNTISQALESVRKHLGMEIAYLSEFIDGQSIFRVVNAPGLEDLIKPGDSHSLDDVYCRHILEGRLPELMADTADYPLAVSMPITKAVPIGAHISVPIRHEDGSAYGMFCCLSPHANKSLNDRDLQVMRVFADMAASQIKREVAANKQLQERRARVEQIISASMFAFVFQPIWDFRTQKPMGFETLCRFTSQPYRSPDKWFNEAAEAECGVQLELAVLKMALEAFPALPNDVYLTFNASPETILSGELEKLFASAPRHRLVLEVTEHSPVRNYGELRAALAPLRDAGVKLAIDDAGAGYSSLQHIIQLKPDIIKLDIGLTHAIDSDPARRALAAALISFARETDCVIVAEGIETANELQTLTLLGIPRGQGYFLGRPMDIASAVMLVAKPVMQKSA